MRAPGLGVGWWGVAVGILAIAIAAPPAVAAVGDGMLTPADVGIGVVSKPHQASVIAVDQVTADCKPGKCRYGLMMNELGFLTDDGVTVRLGDDHFLMHTTSGGAESGEVTNAACVTLAKVSIQIFWNAAACSKGLVVSSMASSTVY